MSIPTHEPSKKSSAFIWIAGGGCLLIAILFAGCATFIGGAALIKADSEASASSSAERAKTRTDNKATSSAPQENKASEENVLEENIPEENQVPEDKDSEENKKTAPSPAQKTQNKHTVELKVTANGAGHVSYWSRGGNASEEFDNEWSTSIDINRKEVHYVLVSGYIPYLSEADHISCSVLVDGEEVESREATGDHASVSCSLPYNYKYKQKK